MHEFGIVEDLVAKLLPQLEAQHITSVSKVRFRRGSTFSEDALRQAFAAASKGTVLEGASLDIETVNLDYQCRCGYQQVVTHDDLEGHLFICPRCGDVHEIDEAHDLELIDMLGEVSQ
jgi:Zn finger protein HypA/HybF involved in hydrogenase expression